MTLPVPLVVACTPMRLASIELLTCAVALLGLFGLLMTALIPMLGASIPPATVTVTLPVPAVVALMPLVPPDLITPFDVTLTLPALAVLVIAASMPSAPAVIAPTAVTVTLPVPAEAALMPMVPAVTAPDRLTMISDAFEAFVIAAMMPAPLVDDVVPVPLTVMPALPAAGPAPVSCATIALLVLLMLPAPVTVTVPVSVVCAKTPNAPPEIRSPWLAVTVTGPLTPVAETPMPRGDPVTLPAPPPNVVTVTTPGALATMAVIPPVTVPPGVTTPLPPA